MWSMNICCIHNHRAKSRRADISRKQGALIPHHRKKLDGPTPKLDEPIRQTKGTSRSHAILNMRDRLVSATILPKSNVGR
jgi:hypothetical protein